LHRLVKPVKVVTVTFALISGRRCLDFAGTKKGRVSPAPEELLTQPALLSEWAMQAGLVDAAFDVTDDNLAAAIALREAIYRTVTARLEHRRPEPADVDLLNDHASRRRITPRLHRAGEVSRAGSAVEVLASLAADLLELLAGPDMQRVKSCAHRGCTRLYVDSSRAGNRHWCGMGTCGNRAKVEAFRARQRASGGRSAPTTRRNG
jgi:predicted RNA-binding Zn ribbon-like protein